MARLRFVQPELVRLALTEDDYIDVKVELTAGEERAAFARMTTSLEAGKAPQLNPEQVELSTLLAYIVRWSFADKDGRPVEVSESALQALDSETFRELFEAVTAHEQQVLAKKKASRDAGNKSSPTSPSPG